MSAPACKGEIGEPVDGDGTINRPIPPPSCDDPGLKPSDVPIRRITDLQYQNAIYDLFADAVAPSIQFPATTEWDGYSTSPEANTVSALGAENIMRAAEDVAVQVVPILSTILPCATNADEACAQQFITDFGARAFRRPVRSDEEAMLLDLYRTAIVDTPYPETIGVVLTAILQMPAFLYHVEEGRQNVEVEPGVVPLTGHEIANRLSFLFLDTIPDPELRAAAEAGQLDTADGIRTQAERLLADPKSHEVVARFTREWLEVSTITEDQKDRALFPQFDANLAASMDQELDRFVVHVMANQNASFEAMMQTSESVVNQPLADLYGVNPNPSMGPNDWHVATLDPGHRTGVLTRASVLANHSHPGETSPVYRGEVVRTQFLCTDLPAPPPTAQTSVPEFPPGTNAREKTEIFLASEACGGCHRLMNPIGLGYERFDAIGARRTTYEDGTQIDVSGDVVGAPEIGRFDGAAQLATKLAQSDTVHDCYTRQWFRYAYGRRETQYDTCSVDDTRGRFVDAGLSIRELLVAMTQTDAFRYRRTVAMQDRIAAVQ